MSKQYGHPSEVPDDVLLARIGELVTAITKPGIDMRNEFTMRIPAECDRDADIVLSEIVRRYRHLIPRPKENKMQEWKDGLPPVGTICEYEWGRSSRIKVEITGQGRKGVCFVDVNSGREHYGDDARMFAPIDIRTDKEKWIDAAAEAVACRNYMNKQQVRIYLGLLYDAGLGKLPGGVE